MWVWVCMMASGKAVSSFAFHFTMPGSIVLNGFWYVELWSAKTCQWMLRPRSSFVKAVPSTISSMLTFAILHWLMYMWMVSSLSGGAGGMYISGMYMG